MTALVQFLVELVRWTTAATPEASVRSYEGTGISAGPFLSHPDHVVSTIVAGSLVFYRREVIR